jgi:hypothetical protein
METIMVRSLLAWAGSAIALVTLSGCTNNYTCYDYRSCMPDGAAEGSTATSDGQSDVRKKQEGGSRSDARLDGEAPHDGGVDVVTKADGGDGSTCDTSKSPSEEPCLVSDAYGVFVAPSGTDTSGGGTQVAPFATVGYAITNAGVRNVYVCSGTYPPVSVTMAAKVYGGFVCPVVDGGAGDAGGPAWSFTSTQPVVESTMAGTYALDIESGAAAVHFENMSFVAADASGTGVAAGTSSIAVFVNASGNVSWVQIPLCCTVPYSCVAVEPTSGRAL